MVCSLPCDQLPCSEPCTKFLSCGIHVCPGLCSEACISECTQCKNGSFPDEHQIRLDCGHTFTVKEVDAAFNLKDYYEVDENGTIKAGSVSKIPSPESLRCPECCRPVCKAQRYALASQLQDMIPTIERYYAKMGRKLATAAADLFGTGDILHDNAERFFQQLQTGPLRAPKNKRLVFDRGNMTLELQQHVTKLRDELVLPFEDNLQRLVPFVNNPDVLAQVVPTFQFRYRLVYYLCRLVTLEDGLKVFQYLSQLDDIDPHTFILIEGLKAKISDHSIAELKSLETTIAESTAGYLPRIEVELRLAQLGFHSILKGLAVNSAIDPKTSLEKIHQLCQRFPETAGKLAGPVKEFEQRLKTAKGGEVAGRFLDIYGKGSKDLVFKLGGWKVGGLTHCAHHHPYSTNSFSSCPECGREVQVTAPEVFQDAKELATSEAFMKKAHSIGVTGRFADNLKKYRTK